MTVITWHKAWAWAQTLLEQAKVDPENLMYVVRERFNWTPSFLAFHQDKELTLSQWQQLQRDTQQLATGLPPQYLVGHAWFYGQPFAVSPAVLIPRPETEELMEWVLSEFPDVSAPYQVLDLGTGSGVLGITFSLQRPRAQVLATDISRPALQQAQVNNQNLGAQVHFKQADGLTGLSPTRFDLIVSNPPYIAQEERSVMDRSVLDYEPETALFAANHGLAFYQLFAQEAKNWLKPRGRIMFEFGYQQAPALSALFAQDPNLTFTWRRDLAGWPRMGCLTRKEEV